MLWFLSFAACVNIHHSRGKLDCIGIEITSGSVEMSNLLSELEGQLYNARDKFFEVRLTFYASFRATSSTVAFRNWKRKCNSLICWQDVFLGQQ